MMLRFSDPWALVLLGAIPLLLGAFLYGDRRRLAALAVWRGTPVVLPRHRRRFVKPALQSAAIATLAVALAGPSWSGPEPRQPQQSRAGDIVFLLDVSRSMLAADVHPSRLSRAKAVIRQLAEEARGDRVALVAFAGSQAVACPLTIDHAFFNEMLDYASPDSVTRGGSRLGAAIRFAMERVFDDVKRDRRTLVLLSDGEDHGSDPQSAAGEAGRAKVRLVTIGMGEEAGALVPISAGDPTPYLYQGAPVRSRLVAASLQAVASAGEGGAYIRAGNDAIDAAALYRKWLAPSGRPEAARAGDSGAAWLVLLTLAIVLLAIEPQIRDRSVVALLVLALLLRPGKAAAQTVEEWFGKGMDAMNAHQYAQAMSYFGNAATWAPDIPEIRFNLATALYDFRSYAEAALSFDHAARIAGDRHLKALSRLGQGNALFRDATYGDTHPGYAIPRLRAAIEAYRAALQLEPDLFNAEVNLKVAERRLSRAQQAELPPQPRMPGAEDRNPSSNPDQILGKAGRPPAPRVISKPAGVDKDW